MSMTHMLNLIFNCQGMFYWSNFIEKSLNKLVLSYGNKTVCISYILKISSMVNISWLLLQIDFWFPCNLICWPSDTTHCLYEQSNHTIKMPIWQSALLRMCFECKLLRITLKNFMTYNCGLNNFCSLCTFIQFIICYGLLIRVIAHKVSFTYNLSFATFIHFILSFIANVLKNVHQHICFHLYHLKPYSISFPF